MGIQEAVAALRLIRASNEDAIDIAISGLEAWKKVLRDINGIVSTDVRSEAMKQACLTTIKKFLPGDIYDLS